MSNHDPSPTDRALTEPQIAVPLSRRRRLGMFLKFIELRVRFIVLMAATGLVFASWDTVVNHVDKWSRPEAGRYQSSLSPAGVEWFCPMHPSVTSEQSGQCPSCGMSLARAHAHGHRRSSRQRPVTGPARAGQIAQAGIRTVAVSFVPAVERFTTVGLVGFDDSRRLPGCFGGSRPVADRALRVHAEGEHVRAGQRLRRGL